MNAARESTYLRFSFVIALILGACGASPFPPGTSAIVDQSLINQASCGRLPQYGDGAWRPSEDVIAALEAALLTRLQSELEGEAFPEAPSLTSESYYRRYAGVTHQGRRVVAICAEPRWLYDERNVDWRTQTIPFRDGGAGSLGAHYDPETRRIIYFEFGYVG